MRVYRGHPVTAEDTLRAHVRAALRNAGISQAEACRQLDVTTKHLNQMLTGKATLTLPWAEQILGLCGERLVLDVQQLTTTQDQEPTP